MRDFDAVLVLGMEGCLFLLDFLKFGANARTQIGNFVYKCSLYTFAVFLAPDVVFECNENRSPFHPKLAGFQPKEFYDQHKIIIFQWHFRQVGSFTCFNVRSCFDFQVSWCLCEDAGNSREERLEDICHILHVRSTHVL